MGWMSKSFEKFFAIVGSNSEPGIGINLLVSKIAEVGMPMLTYGKDFECYRISRTTPIRLDGVQCGRRDLQAPSSLR
jgi:hypothetical protein